MLLKKSGLTYEEVRERYEHFRARCVKSRAILLKKKKCTLKKTTHTKTNKKGKKENGCTEPLYGEKSKCVLHIIPQTEKCETFQIDNKCVKKNIMTILQENIEQN